MNINFNGNKKLEQACIKLIHSLRLESFKIHKECVLNEKEYLKLNMNNVKYQIPNNGGLINYQKFDKISLRKFEMILEKGKSKGIDWSQIKLTNFVSDSNMLGGESINNPRQVNGHLGLQYSKKSFSIFGLQHILTNGEYKLNSIELCGLYELENLDYFIPSDEMHLEQLEYDGY